MINKDNTAGTTGTNSKKRGAQKKSSIEDDLYAATAAGDLREVQNIVNNLSDKEISRLNSYVLVDILSDISSYAKIRLALAVETADMFMTAFSVKTFGDKMDFASIGQSELYKKLESIEDSCKDENHIDSVNYSGPDRRWEARIDYMGPFRRKTDGDMVYAVTV